LADAVVVVVMVVDEVEVEGAAGSS